jgi:hypothetical protein
VGIWDESKHHRDLIGEFSGSGGHGKHRKPLHIKTNRNSTMEELAVGHRSQSAFRPPASGTARRERKENVRKAVEIPRGVRPPQTPAERGQLEYAAPVKRTAARAATGHVRMPRKEAIHRAAAFARADFSKQPTTGTKKTFTGKTVRVREVVPPPGVRPTIRGKFNLATNR